MPDAATEVPAGVVNFELERRFAGEGVRSAGHTGVVRPKRHLHHVEFSLVHVAAGDDGPGGVADGEVDAGVVLRRRDDEVHLGNDAVLVGMVVVDEVAARGLDDAYAVARGLGREVADVRV